MPATAKKLGKLGLAMLEHFVESKLGEKFVTELRAGTDRQTAIEGALLATADRLWKEWDDKRLWNAVFNHLPKKKGLLEDLREAVRTFYGHPTDTGFADVLITILREHKEFSEETIQQGVGEYLAVLTEELALIDESFRGNVCAIVELQSGASQKKLVEILGRIEKRIKPQENVAPSNSVEHITINIPYMPHDQKDTISNQSEGVKWSCRDSILLQKYFAICAQYDPEFFGDALSGDELAIQNYLFSSRLSENPVGRVSYPPYLVAGKKPALHYGLFSLSPTAC